MSPTGRGVEDPHPALPQGGGFSDPLAVYFEGIRDAPVPLRLLAETPPEAFARRAMANLLWAVAGLALVVAVASIPSAPDPASAQAAARALGKRVAVRMEGAR